MTNQQGNTAISSKAGSLKGNNEQRGKDECFLGMLDEIESIPDENMMDLKKLQEKSQSDDNMLGMIVKTEQEICSLINDMTLKEVNISELLLGAEENSKENQEKQSSSKAGGQDLLKGQISGNAKDFMLFGFSGNTEAENSSIDKNTMVTASKAESDSGATKLALSEMLNNLVKTEENEKKTGQGELNKNNAGVQVSKGSDGDVGKETGVKVSKGSDGDVGKETGVQVSKGSDGDVGKETGVQISLGSKEDVGKNVEAQLLKGLEADIAKTIKNSETKGKRADVSHRQDIDGEHDCQGSCGRIKNIQQPTHI